MGFCTSVGVIINKNIGAKNHCLLLPVFKKNT
jgi:hypothetical protein